MNKSILTTCLTAVTLLALSGCASSMNGMGASDKLACKAPDGVTCASLSGVYANTIANNLPGLQKRKHTDDDKSTSTPSKTKNSYAGGINQATPGTGDAIFTPQHIVRLWIAPWEDAEGDLHDQQYIYIVAEQGRWLIEHNEQPIVNRYRPTFIKKSAAQIDDVGPKKPKVNSSSVAFPKVQSTNPSQAASGSLGVE